jgi:hypothetical protein
MRLPTERFSLLFLRCLRIDSDDIKSYGPCVDAPSVDPKVDVVVGKIGASRYAHPAPSHKLAAVDKLPEYRKEQRKLNIRIISFG